MATLFARKAMLPGSKAFAAGARTVLSAKCSPISYASAGPLSRRCFSQTFCLRAKRYTESHEWVSLSPDGKTCKIGITTYAAEALGEAVYVELPEMGDEVEKGENFGSLESVKSASEITSPVSGSVIGVNNDLVDKPADLAVDPEGEGWLVEVDTTDTSGVEELMDAAAYAEFTKEE